MRRASGLKITQAVTELASYPDALWVRHVIFLPHEEDYVIGGGRLRDEPKERPRRRL